jgi:hypothetical protein
MPAPSATPPAGGPPGRLYAVAALLARKGRFQEAAGALRRALERGACSEVDALDLQARMLAQQGLRLRAEALWVEAARRAPEDGRFAAALAELRRPRRPLRRWAAGAALALAIGLGAAALAAAWALRSEAQRGRTEAAAELARREAAMEAGRRSQADAAEAAGERLQALAAELAAVRVELGATHAELASTLSTLPSAERLERELRRVSAEHRAAVARLAAEARRREVEATTRCAVDGGDAASGPPPGREEP